MPHVKKRMLFVQNYRSADPSQENCSKKEDKTVLLQVNYAIPKRSPPHLKLHPSSLHILTQFHGLWLLPRSSSSHFPLPTAYSSVFWWTCDGPGSPMAICSGDKSVTTGTVLPTSSISLEKSMIIRLRICCWPWVCWYSKLKWLCSRMRITHARESPAWRSSVPTWTPFCTGTSRHNPNNSIWTTLDNAITVSTHFGHRFHRTMLPGASQTMSNAYLSLSPPNPPKKLPGRLPTLSQEPQVIWSAKWPTGLRVSTAIACCQTDQMPEYPDSEWTRCWFNHPRSLISGSIVLFLSFSLKIL